MGITNCKLRTRKTGTSIRYGNFVFPAKRTFSARKECIPDIAEFSNVVESEDHSMPLNELISRLDTDLEKGLKEEQVESIRERYGSNALKQPPSSVFVGRLPGSFLISISAVIFCFTAAFTPSLQPPPPFSSDYLYLGFLFLLLIIISEWVSYFHENKSIKGMDSFKHLYPRYASVIRDGEKVRIHTEEIVVGDLVLLKAGCRVPADLRITQAFDLKITQHGKPVAERKCPECTSSNPTLSENVAFYKTFCVEGYGQGIVTSTGYRTAFGQMLNKMTVLQEADTAVVGKMEKYLLAIGLTTTVICAVFVIIVVLKKYNWVAALILIIAQIVVSKPKVLLSTIIAGLHWTTGRMASKNCLPKDFKAVEEIGSTTVICCDMTSTITQNRMTVVRIWLDGKMLDVEPTENRTEMKLKEVPHNKTWDAFSRAQSLCSKIASKSRRDRCLIKKGCSCNQAEVAIMEFLNYVSEYSSNEQINITRERYKKVYELPFSSVRNYQVSIHETGDSSEEDGCAYLLVMKGAVEVLLGFCSTALINGDEMPIEVLEISDFHTLFERAMKNGERVIGFCDYKMPLEDYPRGACCFKKQDIPLSGLRFLGFVSILDPPRAPVPEAIAKCRKAGIRVILMTSDHPIAAKAVAKQVGIISSNSETVQEIASRLNVTSQQVTPGHAKAAVISGSELESMDDSDLHKFLKDYEEIVFARITPDQKQKIVKILQSDREVVALTGNTPDDCMAMANANIGVGMGLHGCDISRDIADVILLGDDFGSIVAGIEEGRLVYENLRKAIIYVLSSNGPILSPLIMMCLFNMPLTMGPGFMLLITMIAEIFPVIFILRQKADSNIMKGKRFGARNFFDCRLLHKSYFQIGMFGFLSGMLIFFTLMSQNGFLPKRLVGISSAWNSWAINDLTDSFNQEWTYSSRKSLEHTCQTAFFLSVMVLQWFNFGICRTRVYMPTHPKLSKRFAMTCFGIPGVQILVILFLMYTPGISGGLHFNPLSIYVWLSLLPFPVLLLILEEMRRYFLRHSAKDSWLERETF